MGRRTRTVGVLASTLAVVIAGLVALSAALGETSAAAQDTNSSEPTVVRELPERSSTYQTTYLLSNGLYRMVATQYPLRFRDAKGDWRSIDTRFVTDPASGKLTTAAAIVAVTLGDQSEKAAPVSLTVAGHTLTCDIAELTESAPVASADTATYTAAARDTDLVYRSTGDGLKETIVLRSPAAPDTFTCTITHAGLALARDEVGEWGFYEKGARQPVLRLGAIGVHDAAADEAGLPAWCDAAQMTVTPGEGESIVTYSVPRKWLEDAARIWPVTIDPEFSTRNPTDIYISAGHPGTAYGQSDPQNLFCGNVSTDMGTCKALLKFPQVNNTDNIPAGAHIYDAHFRTRCFWQPGSPNDEVRVGKIEAAGSSAWGESSTWNSTTLDVTHLVSPDVEAGEWLDVSCPGVVQYWVDNVSGHNKGFCLYEGSTAASYAKKFRSGEYSDPDYRPHLVVDYEEPTAAPTQYPAITKIGDTVSVTVQVDNVADLSQISEIRLGINHESGTAHGVMGWFSSNPATTYADYSWIGVRAGSGSWFGFHDTTSTGAQYITPQLSSCSIETVAGHKEATFVFLVNDNWGNTQNNDFDTYLKMDAGDSETWTSDWQQQNTDTDVQPKPLGWLTSTTSASSWFTDPGGVDNTANQGRGAVDLEWTAAPGATGYTIYLWDGTKYDQVDTTSSLSWTTSGKNLYPTDTQIASIPQNFSGSPFAAPYASYDLRDNPAALYTKMAGATSLDTAYHFKVVPTNSAGSQLSPGTTLAGGDVLDYPVTLDKRSLLAHEDPQHTSADLGSWLGHDFSAELDTASLTATVTDLALASWGPEAAVSRSYSSANTTEGVFAPGWFYSFERKLSFPDGTHMHFTDADQQVHEFVGSGSSWTAPNGFLAALTQDGSGWRLTYTDASYLSFDASGVLTRETDANGNYVSYVWSGGDLCITSYLNDDTAGPSIDVDFTDGKIESASETETVGAQEVTRRVDYTDSDPWSATAYPGESGLEREITYDYADARLTSMTLDEWPTPNESALATFTYTGAGGDEFTRLDYPDMFATASGHAVEKSDAKATITYGSNEATVVRYGKVGDTAGSAMNQTVVSWSSETGLETSEQVGTADPATTTYDYAANLQLAGETTTNADDEIVAADTGVIEPDGDQAATNTATGSEASDNQTATYTYDSHHRVVTETTVVGPGESLTKTYSYEGTTNNVTDEACQLSGGAYVSDLQRTYDTYGRLTMERELVSGTPASGTWIETDYADFATNGEPETTVAKAVKLSDAGAASDLTKTSSYDAFGNLLSETDWGGRTTQANTYDLAGNELTTTDAIGVVTHTSYDCMGNATETWKTAPDTDVKADWSVTSYDPKGRALEITTKLSDEDGDPTTQSVVTNTYDGSGNELTSSDTTVTGDETWSYDEYGRVTAHWAQGAADSSDAEQATRTAYDAAGRETGLSEPGNAATPGGAGSQITVYDDAGQKICVSDPDGSSTASTYDGAGNELTSTASLPATGDYRENVVSPASAVKTYDLASRLASAATPSGFLTEYDRDLSGREIGATGADQTETETRYNALGWVLWQRDGSVDANGAVLNVYDTHGNITSRTVGSQGTTVSVYDATTGLLTSSTDPMGNTVTYGYDAFGRPTNETHEDWTDAVLKDLTTAYDSLGRAVSVEDAVSDRAQTWSYPVNTASGVQESITSPSAQTSTDVTRNARGVETARLTTYATATTVTRSVADTTTGRDKADRWKTATLTNTGVSGSRTLSRSFDGAGRIATQSGAGFSSAGSYTYDTGSGLKTEESLPLALGGTINSSYDYTPDRRLASATVGGVAGIYVFDGAGNLSFDIEGATTTAYTYDSANRLSETADGTTTTYYGWDTVNGWRTCQGPTANPTTGNEPIVFTYVKSGTTDSNGRMTRYQNATSGVDAGYTYDASGQRVKSTVTQGGATTTTTFTYDGLTLLGLSAIQGANSWGIDYLYDEDSAPYGGIYRSSQAPSSPIYFTMITTDRGDVVELLDAKGDPFAAYRYDAWGLPRGSGNYATGIWTQSTSLVTTTALAGQIASRQVLRYAGYAYDAESSLYYCSARYYDPATRQWTTSDAAKADGEESAWQYCASDPAGFIDCSGLADRQVDGRFAFRIRTINRDKWRGPTTWYCTLSVTFAQSSNPSYWLVKRVEWFEVTNPIMVSSWAVAGVYERDSFATGWHIQELGYFGKAWPNPTNLDSHSRAGGYQTNSWKWYPWVRSRKYCGSRHQTGAGTSVSFYQELHCWYRASILSGYFSGSLCLPRY
jgi:RHS repeat-associated protein